MPDEVLKTVAGLDLYYLVLDILMLVIVYHMKTLITKMPKMELIKMNR
ncbi:MAG: hypothetical protein O8C66_07765 [Candidatus Methanoperedens sp.]|jgi:hypothetical protein|nr:hypothetical protein [Candidatus Methanoperedens sp.]MCZ7370392.1 hypothetical protein [Candidatus Methanoperedens sp.]